MGQTPFVKVSEFNTGPVSDVPVEPGGSPEQRNRCIAIGAVALTVFLTIFTACYWNRFLAASSGGTSFFAAEQILKGRMPYRDFLFLTPPLHALKLALLIHFFGDQLVVARLDGMVERILTGLMLYFWLVRFCRAASAMLGALVAIILFASDAADSLADYHHDSVFWAVAAGLCASAFLARSSLVRGTVLALGSGLCASLCFLTKQTTGVGILSSIAVMVAFLEWKAGRSRAAHRFLQMLIAAWVLPVLVFLGWLWREHALTSFVQCMVTGSNSKGPYLTILTRPFTQNTFLSITASILTLLFAFWVRRTRPTSQPESWRTVVWVVFFIALIVGVSTASVFTGAWWPGSDPLRGPIPGTREAHPLPFPTLFFDLAQALMLELSITGSMLVFFYYGFRFTKNGLTRREEQIWFMSAASFGVAYMLSLSWAAYSPMVVPGVAMVAALALDRLQGSKGKGFAIVAGLSLLYVYGGFGMKLLRPHGWMFWSEPSIAEALHASKLPKLAGLRISEPTLSLTEEITALVRAHTRPGDSLLVYPYFPLFYSLTEREPSTYVFNHYLDVCPDPLCRQEAAAIRRHPPDAIIYMVEDDKQLTRDEKVYRAGGKSASRGVARAIEDIAPGYHKLLSTQIPNTFRVIEVYTKR